MDYLNIFEGSYLLHCEVFLDKEYYPLDLHLNL
uniref:Uncharacterized protein n=1 Tax=Siphoviridae sp. ctxMM9 TaxID=2827973 RepID=A0A8S5T849_9CAUD|nr:MAG TPA: hypothetical protein [Siphoviridae sp. ctxMM9]